MNIEYIVTTGISVFAFAVSCLSVWYCRRNFKMSRYEFDKRRREEKQAILKAEAVYTNLGNYIFVISNVGKSEARNVVCDFPEDEFSDFIFFGGKSFPFLDSGKSFQIKASACEGKNECPTLTVTWEDDYSPTNSKRLTVSV